MPPVKTVRGRRNGSISVLPLSATMKTSLVTGATGQDGSYLIEKLLSERDPAFDAKPLGEMSGIKYPDINETLASR